MICGKFQVCSSYEVGDAFLRKHWPPKNTDLLEIERGLYTISKLQLRICKTSMVGKLQHGILNRCKLHILEKKTLKFI